MLVFSTGEITDFMNPKVGNHFEFFHRVHDFFFKRIRFRSISDSENCKIISNFLQSLSILFNFGVNGYRCHIECKQIVSINGADVEGHSPTRQSDHSR